MRNRAYFQFFFILISSCTILSKSDLSETELFSINDEPILADEFLYVYEKNNFNNDSIYTSQDVDEYFQLFVDFKLKVAEAKALGLDTTVAFISEYTSYKDQLIKPYLSEAKEQERLVEEAYERMKYEVDASHILVAVSQDALPQDTSIAYEKILQVYRKAKEGVDFGNLAKNYSEDPSAKTNKGRLGYFTAFQMVYPFEEAAYKTPIDSVSKIIRSRFGFHILKVHDKRPFSGKVKVSHIMLRVDASLADTVGVRNKIFEIHDQIGGGADWNEMCQKYSEDARTKNSGGTLPFISLRQINDTAFENIAFGLQNPGEVSDPVRSKYGWHIIRLDEKIGLEPFEVIKESIEKQVAKDDRSRLSKAAVIARLKSQNGFLEYDSVRNCILKNADSSILVGKWQDSVNALVKEDTLFQIESKQYLVASVISDIVSKQSRRTGLNPQEYMSELIDNYIEQSLLQFEEEQLISKNRDFRLLLNEYYEGILLFEIMNKEVWDKAVKDTTGLQSFFDSHQESYYWEKRAKASIFSSPRKKTIEQIREILNDEAYLLFETNINLMQKIDLMDHEGLDSLILVFNEYANSTITIKAEKQTQQTELFKEILNYLDNMGIADTEIIISDQNDIDNKISLQLNSRSKKSLEYLYNKESALNLQVTEKLFEKGDNKVLDSLQWQEGIYDVSWNDNYILVKIDEILEKQAKKLKDVKGLVISDYQNYLNEKWLDRLRNSNAIRINNKTLDNIKKAYSKRLNSTG